MRRRDEYYREMERKGNSARITGKTVLIDPRPPEDISFKSLWGEGVKIRGFSSIATLVTIKTGEEICVDLKEDYFRLRDKYGGKLPELYHRNVINREIKDIAEKAGITSLVKVISMKGGKKDVKNIKKCLLIKNHTARRTFITHSLKHDDALTVAAQAGITIPTLKKSYDLRTKADITLASRERRLKREAKEKTENEKEVA